MSGRTFKVLFVCRHNSARSIMAEALLRKWGGSRFEIQSGGPEPLTSIDPIAADLLHRVSVDTSTLASKSWDQFIGPDAPHFDFVFTVCDTTAELPSPNWPGKPLVVKWAFPDPTDLDGTDIEKRALFNLVFGMVERRVKIFCALPDHRLARLTATDLSDIATNNTQAAEAVA